MAAQEVREAANAAVQKTKAEMEDARVRMLSVYAGKVDPTPVRQVFPLRDFSHPLLPQSDHHSPYAATPRASITGSIASGLSAALGSARVRTTSTQRHASSARGQP